jgi:hypothetical protein
MQPTLETLGGIPGWERTEHSGIVTYYNDLHIITVTGNPAGKGRPWQAWRARTGGGLLMIKDKRGADRWFSTAEKAALAAVEKWVTK